MDIIAIDLKSFYASVECRERGLDPLTTNLVVADPSRTEKTICLAVSPSLKSYGIPGRARLFEVVQRVKAVNKERQRRAPGRSFSGESSDCSELQQRPDLAVGYVVAPPQMAHYMKVSTQIYDIYTKYSVIAAKEKIWATSEKDDYSKTIFEATWAELIDPDTFYQLEKMIGFH